MIRAVILSLAFLFGSPVVAQELKPPQLAIVDVDWNAAAAILDGPLGGPPEDPFGLLNAATGHRFKGVADSTVPVLLPFDAAAFAKELTEAKEPSADLIGQIAGRAMLGNFRASDFFMAGPAGYNAVFAMRLAEVKDFADIRYTEPVYVMFSGFRMTYTLDGKPLPEGAEVKALEADFPGIRRYLHESYVRYSFERFGVTYVAAIYCLDRRPRPKILTCRQADRVAERFLGNLKLAGGTPPPLGQTIDAAVLPRPEPVSTDFSYFSPGYLIPGTGRSKELPGVADYTVYANLRFPIKDPPAFVNSQSFNNWGNCNFTGRSVRNLRKKGTPYSCTVNGLPLVFDESAGANFSFPWRDNFCEHRNFYVGQCPGGEGHQGQDIRPGRCHLFNEGADRCLPYHHEVVAALDGMVLRAAKQEAVFLFANTPSAHVRVRYIHMNPNRLDADGILSGKAVKAGDVIGQAATFNRTERGTSYHLHFDMQVPTKIGFVFVNPYASLVAAYEQLTGARGKEIKPGDTVPPLDPVPPVIVNPAPAPAAVESKEAAPQEAEQKPVEQKASEPQKPAPVAAPPPKVKEKPAVRAKPPRKRPARKKQRRRAPAAAVEDATPYYERN
ncbi:MAG: peptidoglycan DD-metalloendopeptidase family protein [Pseudolabrys sp.]|nr:peptidoglycan DD-metalloendopeptidase family protein [Pseudolabrys sp.]